MEASQITFVKFISEFENSFSYDPPCGPYWSVKYFNLPIRGAHHTFLESRHPKVTKNLCYVLSPVGSQKKSIS